MILAPAAAYITAAPASATTTNDIASLALANIGKGAGWCSTVNSSNNSLGGNAFGGSCTYTTVNGSGYGEYWCSDFAKWVWQNASGGTINISGLTAGSGSFYTYGSNNGTLHTSTSYVPRVGDAIVFNYTGGGVADHVGLVAAVNPDGSIQTANGDFGGASGGSEAYWADTSRVEAVNISASERTVGSTPTYIGMTISAYVTPVGLTSSSGFESAFQANNTDLFTYSSSSGPADTGEGMMKGTSPSIAALAGGGHEIAFQANNGDLYVTGPSGLINTQEGMMAGTSPAIAASPNGGYEVAFQANTGNLFTWTPSSVVNTSEGMMKGSSPGIAALAGGGYEVAFQANTGNLFTWSPSSLVNTQDAMMIGTSPSIAASSSGGYQVAFQTNAGDLYTWSPSTNTVTTTQGMKAGTSPAIAALTSGGYEEAFQANSGNLILWGSSGNADTGQGMMAGTSPAITAQPNGGSEEAFEANTGSLIVWGSSGNANTTQGMLSGTSPSIA
ncbi:CHAP domain-containing protein [Actinocrinis puniceicyclus]|uniref:CHAP domain-containing protein n=1 Tax=Actinocrinis puniceicyclus TaxID=977794 RepID=A0A8J7WRA9_9ACTN|nr:CHAP domain-containing protein [Actinocrinis puniceicyclus]MBS2964125.1 CHAP domain-containing protein [Actinocrinis puniceicyclus]